MRAPIENRAIAETNAIAEASAMSLSRKMNSASFVAGFHLRRFIRRAVIFNALSSAR